MSKSLTCKNCVYYTGVQCHGHGDYWGECSLITNTAKMIAKCNNVDEYDLKFKYLDVCDTICYDDTKCLLFELEEDA